MDLKEAFTRVKNDIFILAKEVTNLKIEILDIKTEIHLLLGYLDDLKLKLMESNNPPISIPTHNPTHNPTVPTIRQITPTHNNIPTHNMPLKALKSQFLPVSTGNEGVPTDRQTNQQTNQHTAQQQDSLVETPTHSFEKHPLTLSEIPIKLELSNLRIQPDLQLNPISKPSIVSNTSFSEENNSNTLSKASEILTNLDALRKEIKHKFKHLTNQEMAVFALIYSLDDKEEIDYSLLASKLSLSESSVRDYVGKMLSKGIPIIKEKLNNKKILLHISPELKRIASIETILNLRAS